LAKSEVKGNFYDYFYKILESPTPERYPSNGEVTYNDLVRGEIVKAYNGDIQTADTWSINQKIVLLTSGKFLIKHQISVNERGSLVVIAKQGIGVFKNIREVEGIFITDDTFYSSVENSFDFAPVSSKKGLTIRGGVIANNFKLSRNLEEDNSTRPAEKFVYRPDFWINSYSGLWAPARIWGEIAP